MSEAETAVDLGSTPRTKAGVFVGVALLHLVAILALVRAFAPDFTAKAVESVVSAFTVTVTTPEPSPTPPPPPAPRHEPDPGAAGNVGKKAKPKEVVAPKPKVVIAKTVAPAAASTGRAVTSGARDAGTGTGAGGQGNGTGSGSGGNGQGGGVVTKAVHISGQISNARDLPVPPGGREARIGKSTILAFSISPEGRVSACRVYRSSGFPETDDAVCRLAQSNLRFRPATNASGDPVTSTFYWQQKYFN
ncbi:MAG: TonB family protein [Sphingomonadales bacterium]|nr:TonB family protein [Sphingomonadales bacterium]